MYIEQLLSPLDFIIRLLPFAATFCARLCCCSRVLVQCPVVNISRSVCLNIFVACVFQQVNHYTRRLVGTVREVVISLGYGDRQDELLTAAVIWQLQDLHRFSVLSIQYTLSTETPADLLWHGNAASAAATAAADSAAAAATADCVVVFSCCCALRYTAWRLRHLIRLGMRLQLVAISTF